MEPEADEQVRRQPDEFPEDEQHQDAIDHDQAEHRGREQRHVDEVTRVACVARHVALGVDLHQQRHGRYDDEHDRAEAVDTQAKIDNEVVAERRIKRQPLVTLEWERMAVGLDDAVQHPE